MSDDDDNVTQFPGPDAEERKKRNAIVKKMSGDAVKEKWRNDDRTELDKAVAQAAPPAIVEPKCHVCTSEYRLWIERQLVSGVSYSHIEEHLPDHKPGRRSISHHFQEHMNLEQATVRMVLNEEADLMGQNYQEGIRGAFTMRGALDVLIRKGYQDAMDNLTTVEMKDIIQAMKLHAEMNEGSGAAAEEEAKLVIGIFKEAIQNILIKGDIIDRDLGMRLLQAISDEVTVLRTEQDFEKQVENILLPG